MANTNPELVGDEILMNQVYGLRREELRQFKRKIQAVIPKGVNQVAKQLLHPAQMVVVTAGPPLDNSQFKSPNYFGQVGQKLMLLTNLSICQTKAMRIESIPIAAPD